MLGQIWNSTPPWSQEEQDANKSDIHSELESGDDYEFNNEDGFNAMKMTTDKGEPSICFGGTRI
jgi:hypothetical protein